MRRLLRIIVLACTLPVAAASAFAAAPEEAGALVDRWAAAYSANDAAALTKLYAAGAILFGTAEPILFDGRQPIGQHFAKLAGSGDSVRICDRWMLAVRDDAVLVTGSYRFERSKDGARASLPGRFTMFIVRRGGEWQISYHTSSRPQAFEQAASDKGARLASTAPIVPAECR